MTIPYAGELAALLTSLCFSIGPTYFTLAGQQIGSINVNRIRLVFALLFSMLAHLALLGRLTPPPASGEQWSWLAISGVIGLVIGDAGLFQAFVLIGPRITLLVFSLSPVIASILAYFIFGELLAPIQLLGMAITLGGIAWVVTERKQGPKRTEREARDYLLGLFFALIGAAGQAGGLITAKFALVEGFPALSGQFIRMLTAAVVMWLIAFARREARETVQTTREHPQALRWILIASFVGPFIGVWSSLVSIQHASVGIASTLMALPPIFLIPISYFVFKEKITPRGVIGTLITLSGVAVLFLS